MQIVEEIRRNGEWPEFHKAKGANVHIFNPQNMIDSPRKDEQNYYIPYFKVAKETVRAWLDSFEKRFPLIDDNKMYRGILLTYHNDGHEPQHGAAVVEYTKNKLN